MADEVVEFIDPDGTTITLPKRRGATGWFGLPYERIEDVTPGQPGARLRAVRHGVREVDIPVDWSDTPADLRTMLREWAQILDPTRGDGTLRVISPIGDQREIVCRLSEGMDIEGQLSVFKRTILIFRATDPYWQATADTVVTFMTGASPGSFFPFFPLRLSTSEVFAAASIDNDGDVQTWPVWTFTGPGASIVVRNLTTGKFMSINDPDVTLNGGETITVDTRPGRKAVTLQDGTNLFPNLTDDSSLWPLITGVNAISVEMGGATAASSVRIAYRPLYLSA